MSENDPDTTRSEADPAYFLGEPACTSNNDVKVFVLSPSTLRDIGLTINTANDTKKSQNYIGTQMVKQEILKMLNLQEKDCKSYVNPHGTPQGSAMNAKETSIIKDLNVIPVGTIEALPLNGITLSKSTNAALQDQKHFIINNTKKSINVTTNITNKEDNSTELTGLQKHSKKSSNADKTLNTHTETSVATLTVHSTPCNNNAEILTISEQVQKKRRGRPPNKSKDTLLNQSIKSSVNPEQSQKMKKGNITKKNQSLAINEGNVNSSEKEDAPSNQETLQNRKRKRSSKTMDSETSEPVSTSQEQIRTLEQLERVNKESLGAVEQTQKRKRGRPRKQDKEKAVNNGEIVTGIIKVQQSDMEKSTDRINLSGKSNLNSVSEDVNNSIVTQSNATSNYFDNNTNIDNVAQNTFSTNNEENTLSNSDGDIARKRIKKTVQTNHSIDSCSDDSNEMPETVVIRRGRGRPRSDSKRGRGIPRALVDTEYVPRRSNSEVQNPKENNSGATNKIANDTPVKQAPVVKCARCELDIVRNQWSIHNLTRHNNMARRTHDEPLDLDNDEKLLKRVLTAAIKKKGHLTCEKCRAIKRSVVGFISHMQFCGKTGEERKALMVTCEICKAVMMPSSADIHKSVHRQAKPPKNIVEVHYERGKRKAAEKAITKILEAIGDNKSENPSTDGTTSVLFKNLIQLPELKRPIFPNIKSMWKRELNTRGTIRCRQPNCTFTESSIEAMYEHYSMCNFTPQENYMCKVCKLCTLSRDEILDHVKKEHSMEDVQDEYSEFEVKNDDDPEMKNNDLEVKNDTIDENNGNEDTALIRRIKESLNIYDGDSWPFFRDKPYKLYSAAFDWTLEFEAKNYNLRLFDEYLPNPFTLLENEDAAKYLPELKISMPTKQKRENDNVQLKVSMPAKQENEQSENTKKDWKYWHRFEGDIDEDVPTFFTGGPVWALAWLPIPIPMYSKEVTQYLALSTHSTMESEYEIGQSYSGSNMIQIWNVGTLNNEGKIKTPPKLSYAIAHNSGTIWCLQWCPSGCYQDESLNNFEKNSDKAKRMGLLAAACSDGCVNIYSLPFPDELGFEKSKNHEWPIYTTEPRIKLIAKLPKYDAGEQNWQCTKISWTKEKGHDKIAAAFSNGYIGIWDLMADSPLTEYRGNTVYLSACRYFYAHKSSVTTVIFLPYHDGRYLCSTGMDCCYKIWDLEHIGNPVPVEYLKKGLIVDSALMLNWRSMIISFDDAFGMGGLTNTYLIATRGLDHKTSVLLPTISSVFTVSVCDHANGIAHGSLAGEILTVFPLRLCLQKDMDRLTKRRRISSFIEVVDFSENQNSDENEKIKTEKKTDKKEYVYMPETYDECKDRFGLIFHDNTEYAFERPRKHVNAEALTSPQIEQYPFMSVNRISWNPNAWSYLWLAGGYGHGLVRLLNFKFPSMNMDQQSTKPRPIDLVSKYAHSMLNNKDNNPL